MCPSLFHQPQILPAANMNFLDLYLHFCCVRKLPLASPLVEMYMSELSNKLIYSVCERACGRTCTDTCLCEYECIHATVCYESQRKLTGVGSLLPLQLELRSSGLCRKHVYLLSHRASFKMTQDHWIGQCSPQCSTGQWVVRATMTGVRRGFCNYIHILSKLLCILCSGDICYG